MRLDGASVHGCHALLYIALFLVTCYCNDCNPVNIVKRARRPSGVWWRDTSGFGLRMQCLAAAPRTGSRCASWRLWSACPRRSRGSAANRSLRPSMSRRFGPPSLKEQQHLCMHPACTALWQYQQCCSTTGAASGEELHHCDRVARGRGG